MPNQRAEGKRLIGAMATRELWQGVDAWLREHPESTTSDFLLDAIYQKLQREGLAVSPSALRDERGRVPVSKSVEARVSYLRKSRPGRKSS